VYGKDVEKDYVKELHDLVKKESLQERVKFVGPVTMEKLKDVYKKHRLMVNMASETIDKTTLEAMLFGNYPITTKGNSKAIGLPQSIQNDDPKEIAEFIVSGKWKQYDAIQLQDIVKKNHSLPSLIQKMNKYISEGV
jgi:glycosyltransferase involved in cell wall biosynthesis